MITCKAGKQSRISVQVHLNTRRHFLLVLLSPCQADYYRLSAVRATGSPITRRINSYRAEIPTSVYTVLESMVLAPNKVATKSMLNKPTRPQLSPPMIRRIMAIQSIVFILLNAIPPVHCLLKLRAMKYVLDHTTMHSFSTQSVLNTAAGIF